MPPVNCNPGCDGVGAPAVWSRGQRGRHSPTGVQPLPCVACKSVCSTQSCCKEPDCRAVQGAFRCLASIFSACPGVPLNCSVPYYHAAILCITLALRMLAQCSCMTHSLSRLRMPLTMRTAPNAPAPHGPHAHLHPSELPLHPHKHAPLPPAHSPLPPHHCQKPPPATTQPLQPPSAHRYRRSGLPMTRGSLSCSSSMGATTLPYSIREPAGGRGAKPRAAAACGSMNTVPVRKSAKRAA